eukprot:1811422-Amphidinium_carterae.1
MPSLAYLRPKNPKDFPDLLSVAKRGFCSDPGHDLPHKLNVNGSQGTKDNDVKQQYQSNRVTQ